MHISIIYTHIRIHIHILNFTNTQTYIHTYIQPYIDAYIHTYVHTWVTCVCLLVLYLRMNFMFACSDALIGTKSGIFTKLMDASLEVHVLLRRKHRI